MSTEKETTTPEIMEEHATVNQMQAGDMLRNKREELGLSQAEVADRLRLRLAIIKSIDENNYEFDQVATFTRGYLRSYAKAVSLDEKEVLAALDGFNDAQHAEQEMQSFSRKTKREKNDRRIMKLTWVIFLIIIGISSIWWYQNQQDSLTTSSTADVAEVIEQENLLLSENNSLMNEPASPDRSQFTQSTALESEEVSEVATPSVDEEPVEQSTVASEQSVSESTQPSAEEVAAVTETVIEEVVTEPVDVANNRLVMSFSSDCWVQVKDAAGKTLATGVKKAGSDITLSGELPYSVILGAPEGVSMTFANEPVDLSRYNSGKVARFTLPRS